MYSPKISIVTPVYGVEKYIHQCLDSILKQTFTSWECILVDDGSPDNCGKICDEYAEEDIRFRVFHTENRGVAMARQLGVENVRGRYLIHVDPDDWIEPTMLKEMYEAIEEKGVDILVTDYYNDRTQVGGKLHVKHQNLKNIHTSKELAESILLRRIHGSLCNKIMRYTSYKEVNPIFFQGINYWEDELIWAQMGKYPLSVGYVPKAYYHYITTRVEGIVNSSYTMDSFKERKRYVKILEDLEVDKSILNTKANCVKMGAISNGVSLSKKEFYGYYSPTLRSVLSIRIWYLFLSLLLFYLRLWHCGVFFCRFTKYLKKIKNIISK